MALQGREIGDGGVGLDLIDGERLGEVWRGCLFGSLRSLEHLEKYKFPELFGRQV